MRCAIRKTSTGGNDEVKGKFAKGIFSSDRYFRRAIQRVSARNDQSTLPPTLIVRADMAVSRRCIHLELPSVRGIFALRAATRVESPPSAQEEPLSSRQFNYADRSVIDFLGKFHSSARKEFFATVSKAASLTERLLPSEMFILEYSNPTSTLQSSQSRVSTPQITSTFPSPLLLHSQPCIDARRRCRFLTSRAH